MTGEPRVPRYGVPPPVNPVRFPETRHIFRYRTTMPNNIKQLGKISAVLVLALAILPGCSVRHKDAKGYFLFDEKITVEDLKNFLGVEIYKYKFRCPYTTNIDIFFDNYEKKRNIFRVSHEVHANDVLTILFSFSKLDDTVGSALTSQNQLINYSVILNSFSANTSTLSMVKSGTIDNINYNHNLNYSEIPIHKENDLRKGKTTLRKIFTYTEETETLIGEIYIEAE